MTDLLERLKFGHEFSGAGGCQGCYDSLMGEAASEIERLIAENENLNRALRYWIKLADKKS